MTEVGVLLAVGGLASEQQALAALDRPARGVRVVRRCVDLADLLGAAGGRTASVAVVSPALRRLDQDTFTRLSALGIAVVGLARDDADERWLRQLGLTLVVPADAPDELLLTTVAGAPIATPRHAAEVPPEPPASGGADEEQRRVGVVVAVWGPTGAPGRTTVATTLAAEAAVGGHETLLVDADCYGGAVAQHLGLLDEAPGIAAACRAANLGQLDTAAAVRLARTVAPHLRVLTGLNRADRWPELRPRALEQVLAVGRRLADLVVVDCGFCLEEDEELSYDTSAPRRNGSTLAALEAADVVVAVGSADPVGMTRLVRGLAELREHESAAPWVVVNRVVRRSDRDSVAELLDRHCGVTAAAYVPDDPKSLRTALAAGRTLPEVAPRSPAREALRPLAGELLRAAAREPAA